MAQLRKARRAPACVVGEPGAAAGDVAEAEHVLIPRRDREGKGEGKRKVGWPLPANPA